MPSSELAILVLVVVIAWFAWRLLRGKRSTPGRLMPVAPVEAASSVVPPPIAQNAETDLARLASRARPRGIGDLTTVVQAHVTDQGPADWHFNFTQGSCVLARGLAERASLTISADSQVWHDLAEKRIGFLGANMKGSLRPEGDLGILMKLDDAFAGAPDESLLVGSNQTQLSSNEEFPTTTSTPAAVEAPRPAVMDRHGLFDAIQAVNKDPNLSAAERQAAIVEAIRHNFGSGAVAAIKRDDGTLQSTFTSATLSTASGETGSDLRRAIQNAVRDLPPGATREQKLAAVKAALGTMSNAVPFAAMLDANTSRSFKGTRESLAERIIEGLLEGLLEGN